MLFIIFLNWCGYVEIFTNCYEFFLFVDFFALSLDAIDEKNIQGNVMQSSNGF